MGLKQVDKSLLMVLIVFSIVVLANFKNNILSKTLKVFSFSTVIATTILIIFGLSNVLFGTSTSTLFFHDFSALYDQHPVYFALYLSLSAFFITQNYFSQHNILYKKKVIFPSISLLILMCGIILTASKVVIFVFFTIYFFQLIVLIKNIRVKIIALLSVLFTVLITINVPVIKNRFTEGMKFDLEKFEPTNDISKAKVFTRIDKENLSDLELRYLFNKIGVYHTIQDENILFGYGIGDVQDYLDYYYLTYGLAPNWYEGFNLHNQYLQIFASYGVFVLMFFLAYIIYSFYKAFRNKDYLFIFFLLITTSVFIFESLLSRNKGIVFFIFFNTLFLINSHKNENSPTRNTRSA
ncbi:O-antigen polymerase [Arenibacter sp. H213]|uniref:O-antigen ligase family protein n=1 Tax=Arenibacter antarcticus TaxID=2040469 RepID=A0ABW5V974_9FLAO|nr:O-antigen polymerase [Arenibacter sp. H213]